MLNELPPCPLCQRHTFRNGGSCHGLMVQRTFICESCGAFVRCMDFGRSVGALLTFISRSACKGPDEHGYYTMPEAYSHWVDKVLLPTWRHREEILNNFKSEEWRRWLTDKFYPKFPDCTDYVPYGKRTFYDLPEQAQAFIRKTWGDSHPAGTYLPLPEEIRELVYPPQAPRIPGVHFMVPDQNLKAWVPLNHERSSTLNVPEDPILRRNREYFDKVWTQVSANIEQDLPPRTETKNGYGGIEPWYTFSLNNTTFTVGWRKRVVSIQFEAEQPIDVRDLRDLATADAVTYIAEGPFTWVSPAEFEAAIRLLPETESTPDLSDYLIKSFRENHPDGQRRRAMDGLDGKRDQANHVEVHAWTLNKTIEYLTRLCRAAILAV